MIVVGHLRTCPCQNDLPFFEDVTPRCHLQGFGHILLHEKNRDGLLFIEGAQSPENRSCQLGSKPQRGLIHKEKRRVGHHPPRNGEHFSFTAAQGSRILLGPFFETGKKLINKTKMFSDFVFLSNDVCAHGEIFFDRHPGEQVERFRDIADAFPTHKVPRQTADRISVEFDGLSFRLNQTADGLQGGAFTRPVGPNDADELPALNVERDVPENLQETVPCIEVVDFEHHTVFCFSLRNHGFPLLERFFGIKAMVR